MKIMVETSAHHLHVTRETLDILYGKGYQLMLIKRHVLFTGIELLVIATVPMTETVVDGLHCLTKLTTGKGGTTTAGVDGDNKCKAGVTGGCPQYGFS